MGTGNADEASEGEHWAETSGENASSLTSTRSKGVPKAFLRQPIRVATFSRCVACRTASNVCQFHRRSEAVLRGSIDGTGEDARTTRHGATLLAPYRVSELALEAGAGGSAG